jgi:hypothetical protein
VEIEAREASPAADQGWDPLLVSVGDTATGRSAVSSPRTPGAGGFPLVIRFPSITELCGARPCVQWPAPAPTAASGPCCHRRAKRGEPASIDVDRVGPDRAEACRPCALVRESPGVRAAPSVFVETAPGRMRAFALLARLRLFGSTIIDRSRGRSGYFMGFGSEPRSESPNLGPDPARPLSLIASANGGELVSADLLRVPPERTSWESRSLRPLLLIAAGLSSCDADDLPAQHQGRSTRTGPGRRARRGGPSRSPTPSETHFSPRPEDRHRSRIANRAASRCSADWPNEWRRARSELRARCRESEEYAMKKED